MKDYTYPWPASKLDKEIMEKLFLYREELKAKGVKKSITVLVKEAVENYFFEKDLV